MSINGMPSETDRRRDFRIRIRSTGYHCSYEHPISWDRPRLWRVRQPVNALRHTYWFCPVPQWTHLRNRGESRTLRASDVASRKPMQTPKEAQCSASHRIASVGEAAAKRPCSRS